jgi:hypothetical protein
MGKSDIEDLFESVLINKASEKEMLSQAIDEAKAIGRILNERLREIGE